MNVFFCVGLLVSLSAAALPARGDEPLATMMRHGHWKQVRSIAQAKLKVTPADPEANYLMARVYLQWGDAAAALAHAERAVRAAPTNAGYQWALALVYGEQAERAGVLKQIGLARKFKTITETVLRLEPNHVEARFGMLIFYFKAPGVVGGDKNKAHAAAEAVGRIDRAKGYLAQARLAQEAQQGDRLHDLYKKCVEANPREYECHTALMNIYANQNPRNPAAVEVHAREAIRIEPDRTPGYSGLVRSLVAQKRWNDLDATLAEAEKKVPDDLSPFYSAASALHNDGQDLPRAERYLRKYMTTEREAGRVTHAAAQWRLGLVLERQGRKAEAIAALESALRLDGGFEAAKKDLKRLKG
ncbi:MAG: tetratricopeptide repeat protein [Acidobacteria bacterium]|nr:tetratricopeptide repeat protein [Acidobacteriota bacterium]